MRSIWKGSVAFGLVNVPVLLYSATGDHDIELHQVHDADAGRIRYQRVCEVCGQAVAYEHINRAYEEDGRTVVLTDKDLAALPVSRSREIEVVEFVPSEAVDPIRMDRSYFLEPGSKSPKAYVLLRETLQQTDRTAIAHFSLRQKTRLAALRVHGDVLVLQTLLWDDEVREVHFPSLDQEVSISDRELSMSAQLVESLSEDFTPGKFTDDYQAQLQTLIAAKLAAGDGVQTESVFRGSRPAEGGGGEVLDLMEALRRSVANSKNADATATPRKRAAAKKTAKKAPAKRRVPQTSKPKAG